MEVILCWEF